MLKFFRRGGKSLIAAIHPDRQPIFALDALEQRLFLHAGFEASINFQNTKAPVPAGYRADFGHVFGNRGNGLTYGWDIDNTANARWRRNSASPDVRYDTLNHNNYNGVFTWELAVPNDTYSVRIVAGDPQHYNTTMRLLAENVMVVDGKTSESSRWLDSAALVQVTDGRLTISNGPNANNRICFVEIKAVHVHAPPATPTNFAATVEAHNRVNLTWDDVEDEEEYRIERSLNGNDWAEVVALGSNITSWNDTTVSELTTYQYRIIAANFAGESNPSDSASATTPAAPIIVPPAKPANLDATAANSTRIDLSWDDVSNETSYLIERSTNGTTWATAGTRGADVTSFADLGLSADTTYYYRVTAINDGGSSEPSDVVSETTPNAPPPTVTLTGIDVGTIIAPGSTTVVTPGTDYDIISGGRDIWGSGDGMHFAHQQMTGDYDLVVRLESLFQSSSWAKAGLMVRQTLDKNSINAAILARPGTGDYRFQRRTTTGGSSTATGGGNASYPNTWMRLRRVGNTITAFHSKTGATWTQLGSQTLSLSPTVYVGLAVSTGSDNTTTLAKFRGLTGFAPAVPTAPNAPTNLAAAAQSDRIRLTWNDNANNEDGYVVYRSTDGVNFSPLLPGTLPANTTSFDDTTASAGVTYTYRVVAVNSIGSSALSNQVSATITPGTSTTITWTTVANNPLYRAEALGGVVNGKLYVLGGLLSTSSGIVATPRCDVYDPATNKWTQLPNMPGPPLTHSGTVIIGDEIWLIGGYEGDHPGPGTERVIRFNTSTNTWSENSSLYLPVDIGAGAAAIVGSEIHFFGGMDQSRTIDQTNHVMLDLNNLAAGWQTQPNMPTARNHLSAVAYDGKFYAIGGQLQQEEYQVALATVEVYDPATDTWSTAQSLPQPRSHILSSTFIWNNKIIVLGGEDGFNANKSSVYSFDPATGQWSSMTDLPAPRSTSVAGVIAPNKIISSTGNSPSPTRTTWIGTLS